MTTPNSIPAVIKVPYDRALQVNVVEMPGKRAVAIFMDQHGHLYAPPDQVRFQIFCPPLLKNHVRPPIRAPEVLRFVRRQTPDQAGVLLFERHEGECQRRVLYNAMDLNGALIKLLPDSVTEAVHARGPQATATKNPEHIPESLGAAEGIQWWVWALMVTFMILTGFVLASLIRLLNGEVATLVDAAFPPI